MAGVPMDTATTDGPRNMTPVWVTGGLSVVAAAVGVGFVIDSASKLSSYNDNPNKDTATQGETSAFAADVAFGASALFGVTALALLFLKDEAKPAAPAAAPPPASPAPASPAPSTPPATSSAKKVQWVATPVALPQGAGVGAFMKF